MAVLIACSDFVFQQQLDGSVVFDPSPSIQQLSSSLARHAPFWCFMNHCFAVLGGELVTFGIGVPRRRLLLGAGFV
jgi:hypothetical protein